MTTPFTANLPITRPNPWIGSDVVARRINRSASALDRFLSDPACLVAVAPSLGAAGTLRLDTPFARSSSSPHEWRAHGRLIGNGPRLVLFSRVDVVITPWSRDACELRLIPRAHSLHRWGHRRLRRYWQLAHAAADALLPIIVSASTPAPASPSSAANRPLSLSTA